MCELGDKTLGVMFAIREGIREPVPIESTRWQLLWDYAQLVLATDTPIDRAITYLKDTGSPERARGRLLLRAAERSLRASGDTGEDNT